VGINESALKAALPWLEQAAAIEAAKLPESIATLTLWQRPMVTRIRVVGLVQLASLK
jgi:hypothetical protein